MKTWFNKETQKWESEMPKIFWLVKLIILQVKKFIHVIPRNIKEMIILLLFMVVS